LPGLVGALDVDLDERSGQLLFLPRRGRFARAQAHDHVFPADRLPRVKRDILDDAVALVEHAKNRDALGHGRHARQIGTWRRRRIGNHGLRRVLLAAAVTRRECEDSQQRDSKSFHAYSGIQGS
jgi:hypothetical protein